MSDGTQERLRHDERTAMLISDFDERTFRQALGAFATGVAIVTTLTENGPAGLTVSSFNAVSLSPPLVLFSIGRRARSFPDWEKASRYVVNVLADDQQELSSRFGRASPDKWDGLPIEMTASGPVLADSIAVFECAAHARFDGGDHVILVGRVCAVTRPHPVRRPLLFFGGQYRHIESSGRAAAHDDAYFW